MRTAKRATTRTSLRRRSDSALERGANAPRVLLEPRRIRRFARMHPPGPGDVDRDQVEMQMKYRLPRNRGVELGQHEPRRLHRFLDCPPDLLRGGHGGERVLDRCVEQVLTRPF